MHQRTNGRFRRCGDRRFFAARDPRPFALFEGTGQLRRGSSRRRRRVKTGRPVYEGRANNATLGTIQRFGTPSCQHDAGQNKIVVGDLACSGTEPPGAVDRCLYLEAGVGPAGRGGAPDRDFGGGRGSAQLTHNAPINLIRTGSWFKGADKQTSRVPVGFERGKRPWGGRG